MPFPAIFDGIAALAEKVAGDLLVHRIIFGDENAQALAGGFLGLRNWRRSDGFGVGSLAIANDDGLHDGVVKFGLLDGFHDVDLDAELVAALDIARGEVGSEHHDTCAGELTAAANFGSDSKAIHIGHAAIEDN